MTVIEKPQTEQSHIVVKRRWQQQLLTFLMVVGPGRLASAIAPFAGQFIRKGILLLMVNAAVLGTTAITPAGSWAYGEVMGWPHSLQKKIWQAPGFCAAYILSIAAAAGIVLIPQMHLQVVIVSVQVLAGLILMSAIIFLLRLPNDHELPGAQWVNRRWNNWVNGSMIMLLLALSRPLALQVLAPSRIHIGT